MALRNSSGLGWSNFAGNLRHRVTIEHRTRASDGRGGFTEAWSPLATVWASVLPRRGVTERIEAQQLVSVIIYEVIIRYRSDITSDMRVVWDGCTLYLIGPPYDPNGRRQYLVLECEERKE